VAHADYDPGADRIKIHTVWNEKTLVQAVPGSRWDPHAKVWTVPPAWASVIIMRGVFGEQLTLGQRLVDWAWDLRRTRVDPALALRGALEPPADATTGGGDALRTLYPFQETGLLFMRRAESGLLGDEMGCGRPARPRRCSASSATPSAPTAPGYPRSSFAPTL
jgi:hypothetical protein